MPRVWLALLLFGVAGIAWSQSSVQELLTEARASAREARATYDIHTPDRRFWARALDLTRRALVLEPNNLEAQRLLATTYSEVNWYVRAFEAWNRYLQAGGTLEPQPDDEGPPPAQAFAEAGNQLGYSRYRSGNLAAALGYYQAVIREVPENAEALYWLGRINLELDQPEAARSYFERLLAIDPGHDTASYYLTLISERERVGEAASRAYREGLSAYEEERVLDAFESFARAVRLNDTFVDAASWAGRTALELGRPATAADYWERVLELRPGDAAAKYFLDVAHMQALWGVEAGRAFMEGQTAYARGDAAAAAQAFERAIEANPQMTEAWVWAARASQASGDPEAAVRYWQEVLERRPADEEASYFLEVARQQIEFGSEAGIAFADAVRHYQMAQFEEAESGFRRAVEANPQFATAWGWLGRLYFTRGEYRQAAEAYGRASELEPGNGDYAFFAEEAARLAQEQGAVGGDG
ncbi:MAG TPA: tetratricopeptide repeat protein [Trueperaceae bacterium]